jgi:hypothetical protein
MKFSIITWFTAQNISCEDNIRNRGHQLTLSSASSTQSMLRNFLSQKSVLVSTFSLSLVVPTDYFPSCFPNKTLYAFLIYHMSGSSFSDQNLLDLIILIYMIQSSHYDTLQRVLLS